MFSIFNIRLVAVISLAAGLALPASAAAAPAGPIPLQLHRSGLVIQTAPSLAASPALPPDRADRLGTTGGRVVVVSTAPSGSSRSFDWADAAVGAGITLLVMVTAGAAAAFARSRGRFAVPS
jgi:hypothetical protein